MGKTCQICGKPSGVYPLCKTHLTMKNDGEVIKCETCGMWFEAKNGCSNCKQKESKPENELTCLICGEPSNGKHFCLDCWNQYKDRSIDIRLKHLKFDSILDDYGNLKFKCEDGRHVRSIQEQSIANMLWSMEIQYVYEETVNYFTDDDKMKSIHPDFYLPKYKIYIEHIGFTNKKHDKITEYKRKIYEEQGKKVIFTTPENLTDFKQFIKKELNIL